MSQINYQPTQSTVEPGAKPQPHQPVAKARPQEQRDFDAALERAGQFEAEPGFEPEPELEPGPKARPKLGFEAKPRRHPAIGQAIPQERPDAGPTLQRSGQKQPDFDATLQRAGENELDGEDTSLLDDPFDPLDQPAQMSSNLPVWAPAAPMQPNTMTAQVTSADPVLGGNVAMVLPTINRGTLPDAAPMAADPLSARAVDQQWQINIPSEDRSSSALAMRLVNPGTGYWQVRLGIDPPTRAQLTPNFDRLRDKLRQRSGNRINDLEFDDDMAPESDA